MMTVFIISSTILHVLSQRLDVADARLSLASRRGFRG